MSGRRAPSDALRPRNSSTRWLPAAPLLAFLAVAALLATRLGAGDPSLVPSALIGRPVPRFALAPLDGLATRGPPGLSTADLKAGHVTLVNVFASWCAECHDEHGALMSLAHDPTLEEQGVRLAGFVYKDDPGTARAYLDREGNPFDQVGVDPSGRSGVDFGVYGVPETFVIRGDGTIAFKLVGGISEATRPALMKAIAAARS